MDIAADGFEAFERVKRTKYPLIIMDGSMPNCDGLEATRLILDYERSTKRAHTPIIALSAHAMRGDREKFLEAGMDEYLSKPVSLRDLKNIASRFLPAAHMAKPSVETPQKVLQRTEYVDLAAISKILGLGTGIIQSLVKDFAAHIDEYMCELETAQNADAIARAAHKLRGMAANYRLENISLITADIESAAKSGNTDIQQLLGRLRSETVTFKDSVL